VYLANIYIPDRFFGSLWTAAVTMKKAISSENIVRRVARISLDRLYIAHTRRIIVTAVIARVCFFKT